ncbi:hypothetical protein BASA50_003787 [Batrachochytrium salamandrivorans]|uniref:4-nitrophenylphosphatase n=1 Tax=Batrachochytrium salamandrivorans TaxID=1357716 RepID=A0ABQ8FIP9_9FUNG|nr:hypothetical protein BASA60_005566 [Batrachochytrium salamandrivorans]KAH6574879.1 hypothetical protein BASA62_002244 [Batrachochytrium salamandrivorans]KAH6583962.1 hypothetical protein BASA61_007724 [Batrachochytrium salamandrivorans]KAH6598366.1 hypothetical protein BASA50_003787 [Batrachochytrium salamandrivorans]KAH9245304.1 hypothetical protein BASA81_017234 [Batrachochytrium salamandrivorans]
MHTTELAGLAAKSTHGTTKEIASVYLTENKHIMETISKYDTFLLDCDGVIWLGNTLIPGVVQTLALLRSMGKSILFVTNNSTKSRGEYQKKFESLGLQASVDEIFGSAYASAYYIKHQLHFPANKKVYVCGMSGICKELDEQGIQYIGAQEDNVGVANVGGLTSFNLDPDVGAVLFGLDLDFNYRKLSKAFTYLKSNPECHFLATNSDLTYPVAGTVLPGCGALLSALSTPLQREPVVLGKPHQTMMDVIVNKCNLDRSRTCMVGDRLDTDMEFGKRGGLGTLLVMTGVTSRADLSASTVVPDYVIDSFGLVGGEPHA